MKFLAILSAFTILFLPLIHATDPPAPQVQIQTRIVEVDRDFERELSFNLGAGPVISSFTNNDNSPGVAVGFNIFGGIDYLLNPVVSIFANGTITQFGDKTKFDGGKSVIKFTNVGIETGVELHVYPKFIDPFIILGLTAGGNVNGIQKYKIGDNKDKERIVFEENDNRFMAGVMGGVGATLRTNIGDISLAVIFNGMFTEIRNDTPERSVPFFAEIPLIFNLFRKNPKADDRRDLLLLIKPKIMVDEEE